MINYVQQCQHLCVCVNNCLPSSCGWRKAILSYWLGFSSFAAGILLTHIHCFRIPFVSISPSYTSRKHFNSPFFLMKMYVLCCINSHHNVQNSHYS